MSSARGLHVCSLFLFYTNHGEKNMTVEKVTSIRAFPLAFAIKKCADSWTFLLPRLHGDCNNSRGTYRAHKKPFYHPVTFYLCSSYCFLFVIRQQGRLRVCQWFNKFEQHTFLLQNFIPQYERFLHIFFYFIQISVRMF